MPGAVALHDLTVSYRDHRALHRLSGQFRPGTLTAVVGPNGAGKSTLLGALAGAIRHFEGRLERDPAARIAYLPQASALDRSFPVRVYEVVATGLWPRIGSFRPLHHTDRARVGEVLTAVGLTGFEQRVLGELSTGQVQRTLFARVLVQDADLILLDEPFTAIDARTTAELLQILKRWKEESRTVIAVLHDLEQVRVHFENALLLARESVAWGPTDEVLRPRSPGPCPTDGRPLGRADRALRSEDVKDMLLEPLVEFSFMRRALVATLALALGSAPVGCILVLRRMSLVGDAIAHAVLPGAAVGFILAGLSLSAMSAGGFVAAVTVALAAGFVTRVTPQREDASFAAFYLIALALGVLLVSLHGTQVDLMHMLFGSVLAVDNAALIQIAIVASVTLLALALMYRPLVVESFDPGFLRSVGGPGTVVHMVLLVLLVANLVSAFHALGTLMAVGLMMLPAAAARFWVADLPWMAAVAAAVGAASGAAGLLLSYHAELPSGPCIVLVCGAIYVTSVLFGWRDGIVVHRLRAAHHLVR